MNLKRLMMMFGAATLLCVTVKMAPAAEIYPSRPVKLIVQGAVGSGPDILTRIVAERLEQTWKQPIVILNQAGAGGLLAGQMAASAEPDGYTLYAPTITSYVILPEMHDKLPFDIDADFVPVALLAQTPMMIAVAPSLGVNSMAELIALAKGQPAGLFYAANSRGSLPHLTAERWRAQAGVPLTFVPYPGVGAGLQDLLGGRVSVIVESVGALAGAAKAGSIKPLAVASSARLSSHPDLPTVSETAPGFSAVGWVVLAVPKGTPSELVSKISDALTQVLSDPSLARRFEVLGAIPRPMTGSAVQAFIREEEKTWRPVVRKLGLKAQ